MTTNFNGLILLTDWPKYYSYPKLSMLRKLVFHADTNGFNKVIRRINGRILIKESAFIEWIEEQNGFATEESKDVATDYMKGGLYD